MHTGCYPVAAMTYLKKKGIAPDMADGDEEILRQAASQLRLWA